MTFLCGMLLSFPEVALSSRQGFPLRLMLPKQSPTFADVSSGQVADRIRLFYVWQMVTVPLLIEWSR